MFPFLFLLCRYLLWLTSSSFSGILYKMLLTAKKENFDGNIYMMAPSTISLIMFQCFRMWHSKSCLGFPGIGNVQNWSRFRQEFPSKNVCYATLKKKKQTEFITRQIYILTILRTNCCWKAQAKHRRSISSRGWVEVLCFCFKSHILLK